MVKRKQKFGLDMFKKKVKNAEAGNVENADNQEIMTEVEQTVEKTAKKKNTKPKTEKLKKIKSVKDIIPKNIMQAVIVLQIAATMWSYRLKPATHQCR